MTLGLAGLLWGCFQIRYRMNWRLTLGSLAAAALTTAACAAPYMMAIGSISKKKRLGEIAGWGHPIFSLAQAGSPDWYPPQAFLGQLAEAMQPVLFALAMVWLGAWVVRRRNLPRPGFAGAFVIAGGVGAYGLMLMGLYSHVRYLDYRHVMVPAVLLYPMVGAGIVLIAAEIEAWARSRGLKEGKWASGLLLSGLSLGLVLHSHPLHYDKGYYREAGLYLAQIARPGDYVLAQNSLILHYSQVPGELIFPDRQSGDWLVRRAAGLAKHTTYLVVSDREVALGGPALAERLGPPDFCVMGSFSQKKIKSPDVVRVYRINTIRP